ncbi:MAG: tetratricopeptide repeat protein [Hyphomicrobiales bacterium]|nr:tetratricopeptide repeat protein [Hyphomicrobiales bacterium]
MGSGVLSRFIKLMALATFIMFTFWMGWRYLSPGEPGDYHVREGDIRLSSGEYGHALESFDAALAEAPDHRGALIGKAIALMHMDRPAEAEAVWTHAIDHLTRTLKADDATGRGALAAAHANRGILRDRLERHEEALADYLAALRVDAGAVEGPGMIDKILHNQPQWSTVAKRAMYLQEQFKLPPEQRVLRVPEVDATQRMVKP